MDERAGLGAIAAEAILIAAGGRAILLQIANPAVGHGVADHSHFQSDPFRRLRNTLTYVYALTYGTKEQIAAVRAMVTAAHVPVRSSPESPVPYDARTGELQVWVTATLYDSAVMMRERAFGKLPDRLLDQVYADYKIVGTALQMPAELWPADRAAFAVYWDEQVASLTVDDTTRRVVEDLFHPSAAPWWLRAAMPVTRLVTIGLLPETVRQSFGFPWPQARRRRFELAMTVLVGANRVLPRWVREWPKRRLLSDLDRRLSAHRRSVTV